MANSTLLSAASSATKGHEQFPVRSMLDTDLYKTTMQAAVLKHYPNKQVSYRFTNRSKQMRFNKRAVERVQASIDHLATLRLTPEEESWVRETCPYLPSEYVDYLSTFQFKPREQVRAVFIPQSAGAAGKQDTIQVAHEVQAQNGEASSAIEEEWGDLEIDVTGLWHECILYEVPLMSIVSEVYFEVCDRAWSLKGQRGESARRVIETYSPAATYLLRTSSLLAPAALAKQKAIQLVSQEIRFSEFGTRRRRSYETHRIVMEGLLAGEKSVLSSTTNNDGKTSNNPGKLLGTSNMHFAMMFGVPPVGTVAHEWTMGIAALEGYDHSNLLALQKWDQVFSAPAFIPNSPSHDLTIALTDTFSTKVFWKDLLSSEEGKEIARRWRGLRQDSGDSRIFADRAKKAYEELGVDAKEKVIIFSDGLDVQRCLELADYAKQVGIGAGFGVGTNLTNDFLASEESSSSSLSSSTETVDLDDPYRIDAPKGATKSKALNIVIKLRSIDGHPCVKISDELTKNTGDAEEIRLVKRRFGLDVEHVEDA